MVAIAMMALIGMAVLGIETGRLGLTADEAQNAADIAALAGARALFDGENATTQALAILGQNRIDGHAVGAAQLQALEMGNYDADAKFTANLAPTNAVRAVISYPLHNLLAGMLGMPVSVVTKSAVAMFQGAGGCEPSFPLVIGECLFDQNCTSDACQPFLRAAPNPLDNSAWTGYFGGSSTSEVSTYLPPECGGTASVKLKTGDLINVTNGDLSPLFRGAQCMIDHGLGQVTVPVVPCGFDFVHSMRVLGCATFNMVSVVSSGSPKGITMEGLVKVITSAPAGGPNFGSGPVLLVE